MFEILSLSVIISAQIAREELLFRIVWMKESSGRRTVKSGDGGKAVGPMQIHPIVIDDVNRILREKRFSLKDREDLDKSREIFQVYTKHYAPDRSFERTVRIWNGGPKGPTKKATWDYYQDCLRIAKDLI